MFRGAITHPWPLALLGVLLWSGAAPAQPGEPTQESFDAGPVRVLARVPDKVGLSDAFDVRLTLSHEPAVEVGNPSYEATPAYRILGINEEGPDRIEGRVLRTWTLRVEPMELGELELTGLSLRYRRDGEEWQTAALAVPPVTVVAEYTPAHVDSSMLQDSLAPLPGAADASGTRRTLGLVLLIGGAAALVALLVAWAFARPRPAESPREAALRVLRDAAARADGDAAQRRQTVAAVGDAVRGYLEARYAVPTTRQSTPEFLADPRTRAALDAPRRSALQQFLTHADVGKFAAADPSPTETRAVAHAAEEFLAGEPAR